MNDIDAESLDDLDFDWDDVDLTIFTSETGLSTIPSSCSMVQAAQYKLDLGQLKEADLGLSESDDPSCITGSTEDLVRLYCGDLEKGRTGILENLRELVPQGLKCSAMSPRGTQSSSSLRGVPLDSVTCSSDASSSMSLEPASRANRSSNSYSTPFVVEHSEALGSKPVFSAGIVRVSSPLTPLQEVDEHSSISSRSILSQDEVSKAAAEARRRRAIRREMLVHKLQGLKALLLEASSLMSDVQQAEQVTQIAQMLVPEVALGQQQSLASDETRSLVSASSASVKELEVSATVAETNCTNISDQVHRNSSLNLEASSSSSSSKSTKEPGPSQSEEFFSSSSALSDLAPEVKSSSASVPDHLTELPSGKDPESRRQRRLIRNRLSAALHRQRKRERIDSQHKTINEKDDMIAKLKSQLSEVSSRGDVSSSNVCVIVLFF